MDLRSAERAKWLVSLSSRTYSTVLEPARVDLASGVSLELPFSPGLTVLSGGNGAGKSSLLGVLWRCLAGGGEAPYGVKACPPWVAGVSVAGVADGARWEATLTTQPDGLHVSNTSCPVDVVYLDPSGEADEIVRRLRRDPAREDLLEGVDPAEVGEDLRALAGFVLRKHYDSIAVYEITGLNGEDDPVPLFSVEASGVRYDSLAMGRGELAAMHLVWRLSRLERGSVVFLEEPESHMAVYSHDALVYLLAKLVVDRDLVVVCASHTPSFFRKLPEGSVALVATTPVPSITTSLSSTEIARQLGIAPEGSVHLVAEDETAALLLGELLALVDADLRRRVTIGYSVDGESGVRLAVDRLRSLDGHVGVMGIFDGDQRAVHGAPARVFLPGATAPEIVLQQTLAHWRTGEGGPEPVLPGGAERLRAVLNRLDGIDHHDWIDELAVEYGGKAHVIRALAPLVVAVPSQAVQTSELVAAVRAHLPGV